MGGYIKAQIVDGYAVFTPSAPSSHLTDVMPALRILGFHPITFAELMKQQVDVFNSKEKKSDLVWFQREGHQYWVRWKEGTPYNTEFWLGTHHWTGDGMGYKGEKMKLGLGPNPLWEITKESVGPYSRWAKYDALSGPEFTIDELKKYGLESKTKNHAKKHPLLLGLARDEQALVNAWVDMSSFFDQNQQGRILKFDLGSRNDGHADMSPVTLYPISSRVGTVIGGHFNVFCYDHLIAEPNDWKGYSPRDTSQAAKSARIADPQPGKSLETLAAKS